MAKPDLIEVCNQIDNVVDEFVRDSKTFTAYDITKEVRKRTKEDFLHGQVREYIHNTMEDFPTIYEKVQHPQFGALLYKPVSDKDLTALADSMILKAQIVNPDIGRKILDNFTKLNKNKPSNQGDAAVKTADAVLTVPRAFQDAIDKHFAQSHVKVSPYTDKVVDVTPPVKVVTKPIKCKGTLVQDSEGRLGIPKKVVDRLRRGRASMPQVVVVRRKWDNEHSICGAPLGNTLVYEEVKRYNVDHHGAVRIPKTMLTRMGVPLDKKYKARYEITDQIFIDAV